MFAVQFLSSAQARKITGDMQIKRQLCPEQGALGKRGAKVLGRRLSICHASANPGQKKINTLNLQPCLNEMDLQESQLFSVEEGEEALTSLGLWHLQLFLCTLRRFYNGVLPPSPSLGRRHNPIAALTPHANKITLITLFTLPRPLLSRTAAQNGALCKKCFAAVLIDQP